MSTSRLHQDPAQIAHADEDKFAKYDYMLFFTITIHRLAAFSAFAMIENHYFVNEVNICENSTADIVLILSRDSYEMANFWNPKKLTKCAFDSTTFLRLCKIHRRPVGISLLWLYRDDTMLFVRSEFLFILPFKLSNTHHA